MSDDITYQIQRSRELYQNPYAHLGGDGTFEADVTILSSYSVEALRNSAVPKHRYSDIEIEQIARNLQNRMWRDSRKIWPDKSKLLVTDLLDPEIAFNLLDFDFQRNKSIGQYELDGKLVEVAGIINSNKKNVEISIAFPPQVQNFTAAHELGHAILHEGVGLHRDKPLDGGVKRLGKEYEADKFASFFLMPRKQIFQKFESIFKTKYFILNEATRFALKLDMDKNITNSRELSRILASTNFYDGRSFKSMSEFFQVSVEAMAIRLEELGIVDKDH